MQNILDDKRFIKVDPIHKGWSGDKKYCVTDQSGTRYLLRVRLPARHQARPALFEMMRRVAALDVPTSIPIETGKSGDDTYILQSWIDGEILELELPHLSVAEQYKLGVQSGEYLRKIHSISAPDVKQDWATHFNKKTDRKIKLYGECGLRFNGDTQMLEYIEANRHLLENRPQCFQHGDYHVGNIMLDSEGLKIIDFDRYDFGDPWEEFNRIVWSATASPHFASGQLHGYFGGEPPIEFFKLLAFYICSNTLSSIYWAIPFGQDDVDVMMKQSQDVLQWYDNMKNPIPTWYLKEVTP